MFERSHPESIKLADVAQDHAHSVSAAIIASVFIGELRTADHVNKCIAVYYRFADRNIPWTLSRTVSIARNDISITVNGSVVAGDMMEIEIGRKLIDTREVFWMKGVVLEVVPGRNKQTTCRLQLLEKKVGFHRVNNVLWSLADINSWFYAQFTADCKGDDAGDVFPGSRTFALKKNDALLGTVSMVADSAKGLPIETIFPQEIARLKVEGRILAEAKGLALNSELIDTKEYSFKNFKKQAYLFKLFKTLIDHVRGSSLVTDLVIGCPQRQEFLYKYLMFETMGAPKDIGAQGPIVLMRLDIYRMKRMTDLLKEGPGLYFFKNLTYNKSS